jgi:hypothetical protein
MKFVFVKESEFYGGLRKYIRWVCGAGRELSRRESTASWVRELKGSWSTQNIGGRQDLPIKILG